MLHANDKSLSAPGTPAHAAEAARLPIYGKGEKVTTMEKLQLNVPDLWADHHVLKVRAALGAMDGVQDVIASSAFRMVALSYDPTLTSPVAIMAELDDAGYTVATDGTGVIAESCPRRRRQARPGLDPSRHAPDEDGRAGFEDEAVDRVD